MSASRQSTAQRHQPEPNAVRSAGLRYGFALGCVVLAVIARAGLDPYLGEEHPYSTVFVAVAAVSWFAGPVPALLTALLGYLSAEWLFAGPRHVVFPGGFHDAVGQATFFMVSLAIIFFAGLVQKARAQAESRQAALGREIAERRGAEEALRRAREDLDRAQAVAHTGSWRLNIARNELTLSAETHRMFGVPEGTRLTYETFLSTVHPDDRVRVDRAWKAALGGEPYDIEHRILVGGAVRWVRERAELELDAQGALAGGFGTAQDITERKLIEEELADRARRKDEFLDVLGHELRNPLATISTAVQLIGRGVTGERRAALDEMLGRQVGVLQRLVDDLLDLNRVTSGRIELQLKRVDLGRCLQEAAAPARSRIASRGQQLAVRLPAEEVLLMADERRLEQVVENLLDNASKYTGQGGQIELSGAREGSEAVIRCKDNGRGIPAEIRDRIFEPFTRVLLGEESAEAGVGIGLALVKRLVELHGGAVSAESGGPDAGSEFVVRLPAAEVPIGSPICPRTHAMSA